MKSLNVGDCDENTSRHLSASFLRQKNSGSAPSATAVLPQSQAPRALSSARSTVPIDAKLHAAAQLAIDRGLIPDTSVDALVERLVVEDVGAVVGSGDELTQPLPPLPVPALPPTANATWFLEIARTQEDFRTCSKRDQIARVQILAGHVRQMWFLSHGNAHTFEYHLSNCFNEAVKEALARIEADPSRLATKGARPGKDAWERKVAAAASETLDNNGEEVR